MNTERTHRNRSSKTTSSMLLFGALFKGTSAVNVEGGASVGPSLAPPTFLPAGSNWLKRLFERPLHLTSTVKRLACVSVEESSWRAGRFDGSNFHYCQVGAVVPEDTRDTSNRIGTRMQKLLPWSFTNVPFPRGLECVSRYLYPSISIYLSDLRLHHLMLGIAGNYKIHLAKLQKHRWVKQGFSYIMKWNKT